MRQPSEPGRDMLERAMARLEQATKTGLEALPKQRPLAPGGRQRLSPTPVRAGKIASLQASFSAGERDIVETASQMLERAEPDNDPTGAFVELRRDRTLAAARAARQSWDPEADPHGVRGIPIAVKDVIDIAAWWTRNGTPGLGHRRAGANSHIWQTLADAGAIPLGKTRTHELAWGVTTPGCQNPHRLDAITGGSSGGSAAAVAAGTALLALGTDTGGSIRIPASLCGVVGLKTTHGQLVTRGVSPLAPSQDCLGFLGPTVADVMIGYQVLRPAPEQPTPAMNLRIGIVTDPWAQHLDHEIAAAFAAAIGSLRDSGLTAVEISLPAARLAPAASLVTMLTESAHAWQDEFEQRGSASLGDEVSDLIAVGAGAPANAHQLARRISQQILEQVQTLMRNLDLGAIAIPATPITAPAHGVASIEIDGRREATGAALTRLATLASVTGLPAISVPIGASSSGLPIGMQLIAPRHQEWTLCRYGQLVESIDPWRPRQ